MLAFVCNLEATFGAFESEKLDRLDTEERFLKFEKDIVLDTAADDKNNFIIQVMVDLIFFLEGSCTRVLE